MNINVSGVPPKLRIQFAAKCKRIGKSQRNLLLTWVKNWVEGRRPDEEDTAQPGQDPIHFHDGGPRRIARKREKAA